MYHWFVSLLLKLYYLFFYKMWYNGLLYKSIIKGVKNNTLIFTQLYNTKIHFKGVNNYVSLGGSIEGCKFFVDGDNNKIIIEKNTILHDCEIYVRGFHSTLTIGEKTIIHSNGKIVCQGNNVYIKVGRDCLFSENIDIWNSDTHKIIGENGIVVNQSQSVLINDHVWLGKNVSILKGVSIGKNVVIGMASVVTSSISDNCIAAGNPARIIKENTSWSRDFVF